MTEQPTTLTGVAEALVRRSLVLSLDYQLNEALDLVAPGGTTTETHRPGQVLYGPLTWSVLSSLWSVGYPGRHEELESITSDVRRVIATPASTGADGETTINIRRALVLWRVLAALSQLLEEIAALAAATREWHAAGFPRGLDCRLGERFLTWDPVRDGGIQATLRAFADPNEAASLLSYPDRAEAEAVVGGDDAAVIATLARTSADLASTGFEALAICASPPLRRTFARYKHRISATSPGSAPLWLPHQTTEVWAATDERFTSGFGVFDWAPRSREAVVVLWPATDEDLAGHVLLMTRAFELFGLLIVSLVRFADLTAPALPLLLQPESDLGPGELRAIEALSDSDYRVVAMARRFHPNIKTG